MENNTGHAIVAQKLIEQIKNGEDVSMRKAAEESGYAPQHSYKIAAANSFKKELFFQMPYELLAQIQAKQAQSKTLKRMTFYGLQTVQEVEELLAEVDAKLLANWTNSKGVICGWCRFPNWEQIDRGLDKVYKVMGMYSPEKLELSTPLEDLTQDEIESQLVEEGLLGNNGSNKP